MLVSISFDIFGQIHSIGIQAGVNLTNMTDVSYFSARKYRTGMTTGLNYEFLFPNKHSIEADILYNQQGFKNKLNILNGYDMPTGKIDETKFYYDYLSLNIKVGYTFGHKFIGFVKIGVSPSLLLKAEKTYSTFDLDTNVTGNITVNIKEYVSKYDFGGLIELGAGYMMHDKIEIFTSLLYKNGLAKFSNSIDYPNNHSWDNNKMRHYGFSISIGFNYKIPYNKI